MAHLLFIDRGIPNIGVGYIASFLKSRSQRVSYFRASLKSMFLPNLELDVGEYVRTQCDGKVDLFCFSVMAIDWPWVKEKSALLKLLFPHIPIVVGGPFPTTSPQTILEHDAIDYVCIGDGEEPLLQMAQGVDRGTLTADVRSIPNIGYRQDGKPFIKDISFIVADLDAYPFPDFGIFEGQFSQHFFRYPGLITSRGCPFSCTYCTCPTLKKIYGKVGSFVRQHSVGYMVEFMARMVKDYGTKAFILNDDVFFLNKKWLKEFTAEYRKKVNIPLTCLGNPNCVDEEVACLLRKVNCKLVIVGLQSGSEEVRRNLKRLETNKKVSHMSSCFKRERIHFSINHIFDLPFDSDENIYESALLYNDIRPDLIDTFSLVYFPKAEIIHDAVRFGIMTDVEREIIERGAVSGQVNPYGGKGHTNYSRFNVFFNLIPMLPKKVVASFLRSKERFLRMASYFSVLPGPVAALIKLMLAVRNGTQFIQLAFIPEFFFYYRRKWKV